MDELNCSRDVPKSEKTKDECDESLTKLKNRTEYRMDNLNYEKIISPKAFNKSKKNPNAAAMSCPKNATAYNMHHNRRGVALIFNHKHFESRLGLKVRNGTDADKENLRNTLRQLGFQVHVCDDLTFREIEKTIERYSTFEDHHDADCLFVAILSHGEGGVLYSRDQAYKADRIWSQFTGDKCPSLAGKPKLFFIQACQGDQFDSGVKMQRYTESDSQTLSYKIPTHADFLIAYSTIPGFYSWRNTASGSWFVQALCQVLQRQGRQGINLLSCLTIVCRIVAFDFQSNVPGDREMHEKKQIPCIMSMLTRDVIFEEKME